MKIIRLFLSLFNKRGCFLLGVFVGVVLTAIFCVTRYDVHAEESLDSTGVYMGTATSETYGTDSYYYDGEENYLTIIAGTVEATNADGSFTFNVCIKSGYSIRVERVRPDGSHQTMNSKGGPLYNCTSYAVKFYIFANGDDLYNYFYNNLDPSCALNYGDIVQAEASYTYDGSLPFYDKTSLALTSDKSCLLDANMSQSQQDVFYQFYSDDDIRSPFIVCMSSYAIYARTEDLGTFNSFVIQYGSSNSLGDVLPNSSKIEDLIRFDSSGRLVVNGESFAGELPGNGDFSGSGGRHGGSFSVSETSSLVAYCFEEVKVQDCVTATTHFTRDIMYNGAPFDGYTLIGYMTEISCVLPDDGFGYRYGRQTYSYTWLTQALRDKYGSKSTYYDGTGNQFIGEEYDFNEYGESVDVFSSDSDSLSSDNLLDYVKNGFGLLGSDGYLEMTRRMLLGVPDYIWVIIALAMSVSISVVFFKSLRGM